MKKNFILVCASVLCANVWALNPIVYNGDTLEWNKEFKRTMVGYSPGAEMPEISGMSCSRVTPGYFWIQSDDNSKVAAMKLPSNKNDMATIDLMLKLTDKPSRGDWEGISTGIYRGKKTIFVGAFGDNNLKYNDKYYVHYFDEPAIPSTRKDSTVKIGSNYIWYGYPDSVAHNTESIMYDNVDQVLYIVDKKEMNVNTVFSLDMKDTVYDCNTLVRLKEVCKLGKPGEWRFQRATAADITWDGRWILIKNNTDNYSYTLIWERYPGESVGDALKRQPQQVEAYKLEWQGETLAWLDGSTFYTTSDDDSKTGAPIYKYVRTEPSGFQEVSGGPNYGPAQKLMVDGQILIFTTRGVFNTLGQRIE